MQPTVQTAVARDPKRQPGAYINLDKYLYLVIGEHESSSLLEVENCATLHRSDLSVFDVSRAVLVKRAPVLEETVPGTHWMGAYEKAIEAVADPDDGKGEQ